MSDVGRLMATYRQCVKTIWNEYFAENGDWDDRRDFCDADVPLFRALVLGQVGLQSLRVLPGYVSEREPIMAIGVKPASAEGLRFSRIGDFRDTQPVSADVDVDALDLRYIDLFDMYPLGHRDFADICCHVVSCRSGDEVGSRVLVPFEIASFEISSLGMNQDEVPPR